MKNKKSTAFIICEREPRREEICFRILGKAFILLRGLKTLSTLRDFIPDYVEPENGFNSSSPTITTKKSSQFQ